MRYILLLLCLPVLVFGCNSYEQENNRLKEEIKMLREENNYAKAEIIGLNKELAELAAKVKGEREALQTKLDEERGLMQKKTEEMREAMQKRAEGDKKKGAVAKKEQANNDAAKKALPITGAGTAKKDQLQKNAGSGGNTVKQAGTKTAPQKAADSKKPAGESPGEE
jgi:predicted  nucleic acid-binding Zn-ribbon protein